MIRGGVTVLMVLGLCGRLVVPVSHAHAYYTPEQQREHNAVPHVHIGDETHSHSHDHGYPGHHHHDEQKSSSSTPVERSTVLAPGQHHDFDAVWLPSADGSKFCVKSAVTHVAADAGAVASQPIPVCDDDVARWRLTACDTRGPPCKLYILLRTLRN